MTSSYKDPLSVQDVGEDDENDAGGPVMETCCKPEEDGKVGAMEKADVDVRMGALPPGQRIPRGQKNTPASHTGPKGVIKDYNIAKQNLENTKMMARLRAEDALNEKATGVHQFVDNEAVAAAAAAAAAALAAPKKKKTTADSDGESDSDPDLDEDDDAFFKQYKQQRVADVQATLPRYGVHARVDVDQLTTIVRHENPYVYVVVHLYQNHIEACGRINIALEKLAAQFPFVHFVRIRSTEAMPNYPDAGLPTIVVYRNKKQVKEFVRVTDQLKADGGGISDVTLARLLQKNGILKVPNGLDDPEIKLVDEHFKQLKGSAGPAMVVSIKGLQDGTSSADSKAKPQPATAATAATGTTTASTAATSSDSAKPAATTATPAAAAAAPVATSTPAAAVAASS